LQNSALGHLVLSGLGVGNVEMLQTFPVCLLVSK